MAKNSNSARPASRSVEGRSVEEIAEMIRALPEAQRQELVDAIVVDHRGPGAVVRIDTALIDPNPRNPRQRFDTGARLMRLAQSMRQYGQRAPIQVIRNSAAAGRFLLIDGERRWRAAKSAELPTLRCVIEDLSDREAMYVMVLSHVDREPLSPMELATCLDFLCRPFEEGGMGMANVEAAELFGLEQGQSVSNYRALMRLPAWLQELVHLGNVPMTAARDVRTALADSDPALNDEFRRQCEERFTSAHDPPTRDDFLALFRRLEGTFKRPRLQMIKGGARLDDDDFKLNGNGELLLKTLVDARGECVSLKEKGFSRPSRDLSKLPKALQGTIEPVPGHGMRIKREYL